MAKIVFKKQKKEVNAAVGATIQEVCDREGIPFPFSCRVGACTTCLCNVMEGAEALEPIEKDGNEAMTLEGNGAGPNQRLGCQLKVAKEGTVVLESVD